MTTNAEEIAAPSHILRELGTVERLFHRVSKRTDAHFCIVGEVLGPLDVVALRTACEHIRRRHPMLSARIATGPRGTPTVYHSDAKVEVRILDASSEDWTALVALEVSRPFSDARGPMFRVHLLPAEDKATLVFTFNHTLLDGRSGVRVMSDVLAHMAGRRLGEKTVPDPLDVFVERALGTLPDGPAAARQDHGQSEPGIPAVAAAPPRHRPRPRISAISFTPSETEQILQASRRAGSTLHGALCAGLAATSHRRASAETFHVLSAVDLRAAVSAPDDICALLVQAAPATFPTGPEADFWDNARKVSRELASVKRPAAVRESVANLQAVAPPDIGVDSAFDAMAAMFTTDAFVTNLGALKIERTYGALTLDRVWGPIPWPASFDVPVFCVSGFNGVQIVELTSTHHAHVLNELKSVLLEQSTPMHWTTHLREVAWAG